MQRSTGLNLSTTLQTMWPLALLFVVLALLHPTLGRIIRSPPLVGNSDSDLECSGLNKNCMEILSTQSISQLQSGGASLDGSGHMVDRTKDTNPSIYTINLYQLKEQVERTNFQNPSTFPSLLRSPKGRVDVITILEELKRSVRDTSVQSRISTSTSSVTGLPLMVPHGQDLNQRRKTIIDTLQLNLPLMNTNSLKENRDPGVSNFLIGQKLSSSEVPCDLEWSNCSGLKISNGTNLLWDDMRRTLAFAWELHVFGSASLFALLAGMAILGVVGASTALHPLCECFTLVNSFLLLTGTLRAVLLLLDPYGTRQILSRHTLAALHNLPLHFLLWAQVALCQISLKGVTLILLPLNLRRPWVVVVLAVLHCTTLLVVDLLSPVLSPALPLLLQTLSLCCGLPFCIAVLLQFCCLHLRLYFRTHKSQWGTPQGIENHARRAMIACSLLGVLCCSLQMYSLLWLYGLLGNWRRFSWGWWLSQFWARVLELAWGSFLLVLGSWIFWGPQKSRSRSVHWQDWSKALDNTSFWDRILINTGKGQFRKSENNWEDMMPNTWNRYNIYRTGMNKNTVSKYDDQMSAIIPDHMPCPVTGKSCDSQAALLWQRVGERECILSLIELDMQPPSPINLRGSIDHALNHGPFSVGSLFTSLPPPWTDKGNSDVFHGDGSMTPPGPGHVGYGHFQNKELRETPNVYTGHIPYKSPNTDVQRETQRTEKKATNASTISELMHQDWSDDDVTDL